MHGVKDVAVRKLGEDEAVACEGWPVWSCGVSSFDWDYTQTETCLVIEGKVTVSDRGAKGESVSFGAGDLVVFPEGLLCVWKIEEAVRKYYSFS